MKKLILIICLMAVGEANLFAFQMIHFSLGKTYTDPYHSGEGPNRNPTVCPDVSQDGHILYFNNVGYDLELVLLDEDGEEVYSTLVTAGTSAVVLPSTLTGDYELQLYPSGEYYFYSDITL